MELHGGNIYRYPEHYDFSANLNPLGMPDAVRQAVIGNAGLWEHYPDPECLVLRDRFSGCEDVSPEQLVCGNGADDLIWRIVQAVKPKTALLFPPAFSEYRRALESIDCQISIMPFSPENDFAWTEAMLPAFSAKPDIAILCTPNNPTGQLVPPEYMQEICRICGENGTLLLSDECFLDFVPEGQKYSIRQHLSPHCIRLNAFTKTFAMPGLRLGYAVFGDTVLAEKVRQTGQYWSVSVPAQTAGLAALDETAYLGQARQLIAEERAFLTEGLRRSGIRVFPSAANFILFQEEKGLFRALLEAHILIRSCGNFEGLDETFCRIAVRKHSENTILLEALRRCI